MFNTKEKINNYIEPANNKKYDKEKKTLQINNTYSAWIDEHNKSIDILEQNNLIKTINLPNEVNPKEILAYIDHIANILIDKHEEDITPEYIEKKIIQFINEPKKFENKQTTKI